jgi:hypothetical protein
MPIIAATREAKIRRTEFQGQPRGKISKTPSQQNKLGVMVHNYNHSYAGGIDRRIKVHCWPQVKSDTLPKK